MHSFKKKFFIFFFITYSFNSLSNDNIYYLDIDFLFKNSSYGKIIILDLDTKKKNNFDNLKSKQDELIKIENDLAKKKNIISDTEFKKNFDNLKKQVKTYKNEKDKINKVFNTQKNKQISIFFNKVNPIIQKYMLVNSIDIILDKKNVFIGSNKYDITEDIVKLIDKEIK